MAGMLLLSLPSTAFATQTITNTDSGSLDVTYTYEGPENEYILTIPDTIRLTENEAQLGKLSLDVKALGEHKYLEVYVSSPNYDGWDWYLKDESGTKLKYEFLYDYDGYGPRVEVGSSNLLEAYGATFVETNLYGRVSEAPAYAGTYSDTLTFSVFLGTDIFSFLEKEENVVKEDCGTSMYGHFQNLGDRVWDLNGHTITGIGLAGMYLYGTRLTINDSAGGGVIKNLLVDANPKGNYNCASQITINGGTFLDRGEVVRASGSGASITINDGYFGEPFTEDYGKDLYHHTITVGEYATVTINNGTFNGNVLVNSLSKGTINGGTINGYLMLWYDNANVTVNGGTITGGIYLHEGVTTRAQLLINGGTFTGGLIDENNNATSVVKISGGSFDFDPTPYVNTDTHTVTSDGTMWTVTAK